MDREEYLYTFLATKEPAESAAPDATLCLQFMENRNLQTEIRVRARLMGIEQEQGLGPNDLDPVWATIGLQRGWPTPQA